MSTSRLLALAVFTSACGGASADDRQPPTATEIAVQEGQRKTSIEPSVNPDAAVMADFKGRVAGYAELHKQLARGEAELERNSDPVEINKAKDALAAKVKAARANAKPGDMFTPELRVVFRKLLAPELKGEEGRDARAVLKDDAPPTSAIPFKINAKYPENQPLPSVPANILLALPSLPAPLEYRLIGRHVLLLDTAADLIVDYMLNVVPSVP